MEGEESAVVAVTVLFRRARAGTAVEAIVCISVLSFSWKEIIDQFINRLFRGSTEMWERSKKKKGGRKSFVEPVDSRWY